jgi:hypothetical protein
MEKFCFPKSTFLPLAEDLNATISPEGLIFNAASDACTALTELITGTGFALLLNCSTSGKRSPTFGVFPNPANKSVTVSLNELKGTADLLLYDIYGKLLSKQRTSQLYSQVDISSLPSGTYIIRIRNNGKETNLKIVKQ